MVCLAIALHWRPGERGFNVLARGQRIGEGIHAVAYEYLHDENLVVLDSRHKPKLDFIHFLGLTATPIREVERNGYHHRHEALVVRLTTLDADNEDDYTLFYNVIKPEADRLESRYHALRREHGDIGAVERLYTICSMFPIHRPAIEFMYANRFDYWYSFDTHGDNYLLCPVTGKIYPYDAVIARHR